MPFLVIGFKRLKRKEKKSKEKKGKPDLCWKKAVYDRETWAVEPMMSSIWDVRGWLDTQVNSRGYRYSLGVIHLATLVENTRIA